MEERDEETGSLKKTVVKKFFEHTAQDILVVNRKIHIHLICLKTYEL